MDAILLVRPQSTHTAAPSTSVEGEESLVDFQQRIYDAMEVAEREARRRSITSKLFIVVSAGDQRFAIAADDMKTIVEVPEIAPIPAQVRGIVGLIQVGGTVYALRDIAATFGKSRSATQTYTARCVCLAPHVDDGLALLVSRIEESCEEQDLAPDVVRLTAAMLKNPTP